MQGFFVKNTGSTQKEEKRAMVKVGKGDCLFLPLSVFMCSPTHRSSYPFIALPTVLLVHAHQISRDFFKRTVLDLVTLNHAHDLAVF